MLLLVNPKKLVRKAGLTCLFMFSFFTGFTQAPVNLVPNPSFEEYSECPISAGMIWAAEPWIYVRGSVDYYNQCGTDGFSVPDNWGGGGDASTGYAYMGLKTWGEITPNGREFVGVYLTETLEKDKRYKIEFKLSLIDSLWYGIKKQNMGVYISNAEPLNNIDTLFSYASQVVRDTNANEYEYYDVKDGWADKFTGLYIAEGNERFITIGNFDRDDNTDTVSVLGGGIFRPAQPYYWASAGYFIDDVSVILDTTYSVGIDPVNPEGRFAIYPNPAKNNLTIETSLSGQAILQLYDVTGRIVLIQQLSAQKTTFDISTLPAGAYTGVLMQNNAVVCRSKILIE